MFLKYKKINNKIYWSLVESYRECGKVKQRILKNLGTTEKALKLLEGRQEYQEYYSKIFSMANIDTSEVKNNTNNKSSVNLFDVFSFKYIRIKKNKVVDEELKLTYKSIETIIEMGMDYIEILKKKLNEMDEDQSYNKMVYNFKIEEIKKITNYLIETTGYCKKCKVKKDDDIGLDGFEALLKLKK